MLFACGLPLRDVPRKTWDSVMEPLIGSKNFVLVLGVTFYARSNYGARFSICSRFSGNITQLTQNGYFFKLNIFWPFFFNRCVFTGKIQCIKPHSKICITKKVVVKKLDFFIIFWFSSTFFLELQKILKRSTSNKKHIRNLHIKLHRTGCIWVKKTVVQAVKRDKQRFRPAIFFRKVTRFSSRFYSTYIKSSIIIINRWGIR